MVEYYEITFHLTLAIYFLAGVFYKVLEYHAGRETGRWLMTFLIVFGFLSALSVTRALELFAEILSAL